jgi:hypothetical protein
VLVLTKIKKKKHYLSPKAKVMFRTNGVRPYKYYNKGEKQMKVVIEGTPEEIKALLGEKKKTKETDWTEFKYRWVKDHPGYASYNYPKPPTSDHPGLD